MSSILTTAGLAHLAELEAGGSLTNSFDGLVFGRGNDVPSVTDTLSEVSVRQPFVLKLADGYPKKDDTDSRNGGRGSSTWTWRFERGAGEPFVASNAAVTNYSGGALIEGAPLLFHADEITAQRPDERLIVWVNAHASDGASIFTATEEALEGRVQRVVGYVARNRAISASPNGSVVSSTEVHVKAAPGQHVWIATDIPGLQGQQLQPADVKDLTLTVERLKASTGQWVEIGADDNLDCYRFVTAAYHYDDRRWNQVGGFNFAHSWIPTAGTREGTFRLIYKMELCDEDIREWKAVVEVRG